VLFEANSVRPLRHPLFAREKLVGVGRPGNREQARIEMTTSVFMTSTSVSMVAKKVRAWRIFGTNTGGLRGREPLGCEGGV